MAMNEHVFARLSGHDLYLCKFLLTAQRSTKTLRERHTRLVCQNLVSVQSVLEGCLRLAVPALHHQDTVQNKLKVYSRRQFSLITV